jgi:signal transduction histidine kinase
MLKRRLLAGFLSSVAVLIVAAFAYRAIGFSLATRTVVRHRRDVMTIVDVTRRHLLQASIGAQGYLLTSDPMYAAAFEEESREIMAQIQKLRDNTADDLIERPRVEVLEAHARAMIEEASEAIRLERSGAHADAETRARRSEAKRLLDRSGEVLDAISDEESRQLDVGRIAYEGDLRSVTEVILGGSLIAFLLGVLVNFGIWRGVEAEERSRLLAAEHERRNAAQRELLEVHERKRLDQQRTLSENLHSANLKLDANVRELAAARTAQDRALAKREQAMALLEKTNVALDQFAYIASHDLKAPLRGIANLSEWIAEDLGAAMTDQSREHMALLRGRILRMESLIDGILAYSRAGRAFTPTEPIPIAPFLKDTIELLAPPEGVVSIALDSGFESLEAEKIPLQQVFMNLVGNALKHAGGPGASIVISGKETDAGWEFSIKDSGPGIDPRYHERIFRIFHTLASRDKVEGTGIGLATVKKLLDSRGGRVWVDSTVGEGATFSFLWPRIDPDSEDTPPPRESGREA